MERNWTDSRDDSEWEVKAIPVQPQMDDGEAFPMIGQTSYTLRFASQGGAIHRLVVDSDVGSRLSELTDAELSELLDAARGLG